MSDPVHIVRNLTRRGPIALQRRRKVADGPYDVFASCFGSDRFCTGSRGVWFMSEDILENIRSFAPEPGPHFGRTTWQGYRREVRVLVSSSLKPKNRNVRKFLIIARARSGTSLLTDLLNSHPDVDCAHEVLSKKVVSPVGYLERLAGKSKARAYGTKLLSYQMVLVQEFQDPVKFLRQLSDLGYRFIHVRRQTFAQTVSLTRAQSSRVFHSDQGKAAVSARIDPEDFVRRLRWNDKLAEYEARCLQEFSRLTLDYETDLAQPDAHAASAARAFAHLGLPSGDVSTALRKLLPRDPRMALKNYDEIQTEVVAAGLGHLLPEA